MRIAMLFAFVLALLPRVWAGQSGKPSPLAHPAVMAARAPAVFWKRGMPRAPTPTATEPRTSISGQESHAAIRVSPPPTPAPTPEDIATALTTVQAGAHRAEVIAKLGQPAYSIATPEGEHLFERCRFRAGSENLASIEFRDGVVTSIDRTAR